MREVLIQRMRSSNQGTLGFLTTPGFFCYSLELPWRGNLRTKSCIPPGSYICELVKSPKFGITYQVKDVPDRSNILIHAGNLAGDTSSGFKTHSKGCIHLGRKSGKLGGQLAVLVSKPTLKDFIKLLSGEPFRLVIKEIGNA